MAIVTVTGSLANSSNGSTSFMGFAVSGATTRAASDTTAWVVKNPGNSQVLMQGSATFLVTGLTAGSNTFMAKYRVDGGTGTFANRTIIVIPLP
jgi:hypothetical protein